MPSKHLTLPVVPPLVPLPGPPERVGLSGESDRVQWLLFLSHPLPIAPKQPRAPGGHWAEQAQLNLEGLKGVMRCRARVKKPPTWLPAAGIRTVGDGL